MKIVRRTELGGYQIPFSHKGRAGGRQKREKLQKPSESGLAGGSYSIHWEGIPYTEYLAISAKREVNSTKMLTRKRVPELMDDPELDFESHAEALRGLEKLNLISNSADSLWSEIEPLARQKSSPLRILDVATGAGDIPIAIWQRAQQAGLVVEIVGSDISPDALKYASDMARKKSASIKFVKMNVFEDALPVGFDIIMTSLFTHHLDPDDVTLLLKKMSSAANSKVLVNDLVRSQISYALVWLGTRIFSRSPIVHYDGPVSVNASYTNTELQQLAIEAGMHKSVIKQCPPCRQLLVWRRDGD